jgi:hypothetical protein
MLHVTQYRGSRIIRSAGQSTNIQSHSSRSTVRLSYLKMVISTSLVKLFRL